MTAVLILAAILLLGPLLQSAFGVAFRVNAPQKEGVVSEELEDRYARLTLMDDVGNADQA